MHIHWTQTDRQTYRQTRDKQADRQETKNRQTMRDRKGRRKGEGGIASISLNIYHLCIYILLLNDEFGKQFLPNIKYFENIFFRV